MSRSLRNDPRRGRRTTCIEGGCREPIDRDRSLYWCAVHETDRRERIGRALDALVGDSREEQQT